MDIFDSFNVYKNSFIKGYKQAGRPGPQRTIASIIAVFIIIYLIQRWTGIPLMDWTLSLLGWIFNILKSLINLL